MSLLKFINNSHHTNTSPIASPTTRSQVHFGRARLDGMPYRGPVFPLRETEFDQFTGIVRDSGVAVFDLNKPDDVKKLIEVIDGSTNGWFTIIDYDKKWIYKGNGEYTMAVYLLWSVPYVEADLNKVAYHMGSMPGDNRALESWIERNRDAGGTG